MNYDQALPILDKEGNDRSAWHMTRRQGSDAKPLPIGDCGDHGKDDQDYRIGHPTEESAYECYRQYLIKLDWVETTVPIATLKNRQPRLEHPCAIEYCETYTTKGLALRWAWKDYWLCDEHRNKAGLQRVVRVGYSVHS